MKKLIIKIIHKLNKNQLFKDSLWSLIGNVIGRGLALFAGIFVARFLGKDIYGEYGIIRNTVLTIGVFSTFGLGYTATKYIADFKKKASEKIWVFVKYANRITFIFSGTMALLLFIFSDIIAENWLEAEHLGGPLLILSVLIVFNAITTTQIGVLSGFGKFKEIAKVNALVGVLTFVLSAFLTYFFGLDGALLALLSVQIINCFLNYIVVKREMKEFPKGDMQADKVFRSEIIRFSTPIALREAIYSVSTWFLGMFIIMYSNYGELGLYNAAIQWNAIILFIPGVLKNVILSHLSHHTDNVEFFYKTVNRMVLVTLISTVIPLIIVFICSNLVEKLYGETFNGIGTLISLAVFIAVLSSTSGVIVQSFISLGKNWLMLNISIIREILIFILSFLFISNNVFGGAESIIAASIISNFLYASVVFIIFLIIKKQNEKTTLYN